MLYKIKNINQTTLMLRSEELKSIAKIRPTDFIRDRKMNLENTVKYILNKRGLTSKMEIEDFNEIVDVKNISAPAVLKQREKLNPEVFVYLMTNSLDLFYNECHDEVKTYKGYVLTAIDGSDFEIPNVPITRNRYNGVIENETCARLTVSVMFDILNKYSIHTCIEKYNYSEKKMATVHLKEAKKIIEKFPIIRVMDRGYPSLDNIYYSIKNNDKFLVRLSSKDFKKEIERMTSNDEIIKIGYEYNRVRYYKEKCPELFNHLKNGNTVDVRCVRISLSTGETEILLTNLEEEKFSSTEINEIYHLRWGIETNYHYLKESLKIEAITSSKDTLIKQDIYSQIFVFNTLQSFINEAEDKIEQEKYINEMKININMATGFMKKAFILILMEEDNELRGNLIDKLYSKITKYIVPIKSNRKSTRKDNVKNKHHINKRKSF